MPKAKFIPTDAQNEALDHFIARARARQTSAYAALCVGFRNGGSPLVSTDEWTPLQRVRNTPGGIAWALDTIITSLDAGDFVHAAGDDRLYRVVCATPSGPNSAALGHKMELGVTLAKRGRAVRIAHVTRGHDVKLGPTV